MAEVVKVLVAVTFYQIDLNSNAIMVEIYDRFVNSDQFVPQERGKLRIGVFMILVFWSVSAFA